MILTHGATVCQYQSIGAGRFFEKQDKVLERFAIEDDANGERGTMLV